MGDVARSLSESSAVDAAPHDPAAMSASLDARLRSALARFGPTELLLAIVVALVIVAFAPVAFAPRWTPRAVLYLAAAPAGAVALFRLARTRDRAGWAAIGFLGIATLSALLSDAPFRSILPTYYRHESVVFWLAALGVWALVRTRSAAGGRLVEYAFVAAVCLTIFVGVAQMVADVRSGTLAMIGRRASGLSLNPVYFGALASGATVWCARTLQLDRDRNGHRNLIVVALAVSMLGVWISGSRIALLGVIGLFGASLLRDPVRRARAVVPAALAGVVLGELVRWLNRTVSGGSTNAATDRLGGAEVASGFGVRREVWGFDWSAFARRPLFGHGPGAHANAIQPHHTPEFVVRTQPDDLLNNWTDAHNVLVELLVTVGAAGLIAAVVFVVLQLRSASGPAAWAAVAIALTWSLQPVSLVTLLPTLALLGAAWPRDRAGGEAANRLVGRARTARAAVTLGVVAAGWLVVSDALLLRADDRRTIAAGELAAVWWWHDPTSAREAAVLGLREAVTGGDPADEAVVLDLARAMTDRDPTLAFWWVQRGDIELIFDRDADARASYERALDALPWSPAALGSLLDLEEDSRRRDEVERRLDVLAELERTGG